MFKSLYLYKKPLFWFFFHLALGLVSVFTPFPLIILFYYFLVSSLKYVNTKQEINPNLSYIIVYLVSFELLARMSKTFPFLPYELSKYLLSILLFYGIYIGYNKGRIGLFMFLLLIPALFYDLSGKVTELDLRFNLIGSFNVGLSVWYFYKQKFTEVGLKKLLLFLLLPIISVLSFTFFKTPDFGSIEFNLSANFNTSGGFGSNQVSTVLGLGMLLIFYLLLVNKSITGFKWIDIFLLLSIGLQGLLTFSRGGMIGGIIGVLIVLFFTFKLFFNFRKNSYSSSARKIILPIILFLSVSFILANEISEGNLLLRYQGETAGTLAGTKEKTLSTITSNRFDIYEGDLELFFDNLIFGVGAGASKYIRPVANGITTHIEFSRLLAEHGFFGMIFILLVIACFFKVLFQKTPQIFKGILFALITLAWYTSFHAATRTFITPLLMGLSLISIVNVESSIHRK